MSDSNDFETPYQRRQAAREQRTASLRRQFSATVDDHHSDSLILEWVEMRLGTSEQIDMLAKSFVMFGEFTMRQRKLLTALMQSRSTAT